MIREPRITVQKLHLIGKLLHTHPPANTGMLWTGAEEDMGADFLDGLDSYLTQAIGEDWPYRSVL